MSRLVAKRDRWTVADGHEQFVHRKRRQENAGRCSGAFGKGDNLRGDSVWWIWTLLETNDLEQDVKKSGLFILEFSVQKHKGNGTNRRI